MAQIGNKQNSFLNGTWGKHATGNRKYTKRQGSKRRRKLSQNICKNWNEDQRGLTKKS